MDELTAVWKEVQESHEKFMLLVDSDAEEDEEEWIEEMSVQFEELEMENFKFVEFCKSPYSSHISKLGVP